MMKSLSLRFLLPFTLITALFSGFLIYRAHTVSEHHVHELLRQQMALAMEFNLAIREYAAEQIRPAMERLVDKDEFHPETMSTSFISRHIFERVQKQFPDCIIRFASENPRNPINKAGPDELRIIEYFKRNPAAPPRIEQIEIQGRRYLAHFAPRWTKSECLRCHGDPKDAPAALVARYGATASFHRQVGELMALDTVAVPLEQLNAALTRETRRQSWALAAGLIVLFGTVMLVFRGVVTQRLEAMAAHFADIAAAPESARLRPLPLATKDEIGVAVAAFNRMIEHLRQAQVSLEDRVRQRTADLTRANEDLRREIAERQRAEQALRDSEARARGSAQLLEGLFNAIPDVIGVQDRHRRIVRYNSAGYRFLGLTPNEAQGRVCYELIGRVKPCEVCATAEALASKQPSQVEKHVPQLGIWLECRAYPVLDEQGEILYVVEHLRDITPRKQAEAALQQRGEDLARLLEVSKTLATTLDLKTVLQTGVDAAGRLLGLDSSAIYLKEGGWLSLEATTWPLPQQTRESVHRVPLAEHPHVEQALSAGRPVLLADTATADLTAAERAFHEALGFRTVVLLPLVTGEQTLGALIVGATGQPQTVSEARMDLGRTLANLVALAVANARLYQAGRHHVAELEREVAERARAEQALDLARRRLEHIARMTDTVIGSSAMAEVAQRLAAQVKEAFGVDACVIRVFENSQLVLLGASGVPSEQLAPVLPISGLAQQILTSGQPLAIPDTHNHPLTKDLAGPATGVFTFVSYAGVPLMVETDIVGILGIYMTQTRRAFTPVDVEHLRIVANHVAVNLSNERLFKTVAAQKQRLEIAVAERQRAEAALAKAELRTRTVLENVPEGIVVADVASRRLVFANETFCRMVGRSREEIVGATPGFLHPIEHRQRVMQEFEQMMRGESRHAGDVPVCRKDGTVISVDINGVHTELDGQPCVLATFTDITELKQAKERQERLQAQLTQAQKMESVGRLAGGVAHDFNNMLQVIMANTALALEDLPQDSPVKESLQEIQKAAQRSADLTRQLLAFARKQTIAPKVLDLNDTVAGMLKMLRRLIGENIELAWKPGANLWPVKMDPSQIDQVLANLCVNARDAITGAGRIDIQTANVTLDDTFVATHSETVPGDYVMLAVSDSGRGMDSETQAHMFEPFFTTKEQGKGTGLGLATVFGIVQQNRGLIRVDSAPGRGTTFEIYLPRTEPQVPTTEAASSKKLLPGTETVLLVEDEELILRLAQRILRQHGYTVLTARSPAAALALVGEYPARIHLLITDVIMPGLNGRELHERLVALKPGLRCLYMSGYTAEVIAHHGVLDEGVHFLPKPFNVETLLRRVREVLEQPAET